MPDYAHELEFAKRVVVDAFQEKGREGLIEVFQKGERDIVTNIDYEIENFIVDRILETFPEDEIVAEEEHHGNTDSARFWVIDPIDGTVNFSRGLPFYGVQIALVENNQVVVSSIYFPKLNELYYASLSGGSYLNSEKIVVSGNQNIKKSILSMGDFTKSVAEIENGRRVNALGILVDHVMKVKMFGAACVDLAYIARGYTDIHLMFSFGLWDLLPGLLIAKEAGAVYKSVDGNEFNINSSNIVIASSHELLDFVIDKLANLDASP